MYNDWSLSQVALKSEDETMMSCEIIIFVYVYVCVCVCVCV